MPLSVVYNVLAYIKQSGTGILWFILLLQVSESAFMQTDPSPIPFVWHDRAALSPRQKGVNARLRRAMRARAQQQPPRGAATIITYAGAGLPDRALPIKAGGAVAG